MTMKTQPPPLSRHKQWCCRGKPTSWGETGVAVCSPAPVGLSADAPALVCPPAAGSFCLLPHSSHQKQPLRPSLQLTFINLSGLLLARLLWHPWRIDQSSWRGSSTTHLCLQSQLLAWASRPSSPHLESGASVSQPWSSKHTALHALDAFLLQHTWFQIMVNLTAFYWTTIIIIRSAKAGKNLKRAGQWALITNVGKHCLNRLKHKCLMIEIQWKRSQHVALAWKK